MSLFATNERLGSVIGPSVASATLRVSVRPSATTLMPSCCCPSRSSLRSCFQRGHCKPKICQRLGDLIPTRVIDAGAHLARMRWRHVYARRRCAGRCTPNAICVRARSQLPRGICASVLLMPIPASVRHRGTSPSSVIGHTAAVCV